MGLIFFFNVDLKFSYSPYNFGILIKISVIVRNPWYYDRFIDFEPDINRGNTFVYVEQEKAEAKPSITNII